MNWWTSAYQLGVSLRNPTIAIGYWTTACQNCWLKSRRTTGPERRVPRWEHEHLLEVVQQRLDANPQAMRQRRETVERPFGTLKARMGATHFLTRTLPKVAAEMALSVLTYNLTRVMNIVGTKPLIRAAIVAWRSKAGPGFSSTSLGWPFLHGQDPHAQTLPLDLGLDFCRPSPADR